MGKKIAIIGGGNLGSAIAEGLLKSKFSKASDIIITKRNTKTLKELQAKGIEVSSDNNVAVKKSEVIILAVKPYQVADVLSGIKKDLSADKILISVVTGVLIKEMEETFKKNIPVFRAMPNTAIAIGQSMTCISTENASTENMELVKSLFDTVGVTIQINEELMTSATALCACGIAFFLRSIRAASHGGTEIGFHAHDALRMAAQTAKGAADLLLQLASHPEQEIDKVTSPKGCTIAGLNEMEHNGFSSAMIKGIKTSADKAAVLYDKED